MSFILRFYVLDIPKVIIQKEITLFVVHVALKITQSKNVCKLDNYNTHNTNINTKRIVENDLCLYIMAVLGLLSAGNLERISFAIMFQRIQS